MDKFYEELKKVLGSTVGDTTQIEALDQKIGKLYAEEVANIKQNRDDIKNEKLELKKKYDNLTTSLGDIEVKDISKIMADNKKYKQDIEVLKATPGESAEKIKELEATWKVRLDQVETDKVELLRLKDEELAEATNKITGLNTEINTNECKRALTANLNDVGVKKSFMTMLVPALLHNVYVEVVGDTRVVKYKNEKGTAFDIKEGIQYWAKDNKQYLGAPVNTAGGAGGSSGNAGALAQLKWDEMSPGQKTELYKLNPELYKQKRATSKKN